MTTKERNLVQIMFETSKTSTLETPGSRHDSGSEIDHVEEFPRWSLSYSASIRSKLQQSGRAFGRNKTQMMTCHRTNLSEVKEFVRMLKPALSFVRNALVRTSNMISIQRVFAIKVWFSWISQFYGNLLFPDVLAISGLIHDFTFHRDDCSKQDIE